MAVFGPTPGTPGNIIHIVTNKTQPIHDLFRFRRRSFSAPALPSKLLRSCRSDSAVQLQARTNCMKSLSELAMTTSMSAASACRVRVAT